VTTGSVKFPEDVNFELLEELIAFILLSTIEDKRFIINTFQPLFKIIHALNRKVGALISQIKHNISYFKLKSIPKQISASGWSFHASFGHLCCVFLGSSVNYFKV